MTTPKWAWNCFTLLGKCNPKYFIYSYMYIFGLMDAINIILSNKLLLMYKKLLTFCVAYLLYSLICSIGIFLVDWWENHHLQKKRQKKLSHVFMICTSSFICLRFLKIYLFKQCLHSTCSSNSGSHGPLINQLGTPFTSFLGLSNWLELQNNVIQ